MKGDFKPGVPRQGEPEGICDYDSAPYDHGVPATLIRVSCEHCGLHVIRKLCEKCATRILKKAERNSGESCGYCQRSVKPSEFYVKVGAL